MKHLLPGLSLIGALALAPLASAQEAAPPLPQGKLRAIGIDKVQRSLTYLVVDGVTSKDGRFDYWLLIVWSPPKPVGQTHMAQAMIHQVIDCRARTFEQTGLAIYDETGVGAGGGDQGTEPAAPIGPNSAIDTLAKTFCDGVAPNETELDGDALALMVAKRFFETR